MKIYCDMEFTGLRKNTELISVGIVADDGRVFYAESNEYSLENINEEDREWLNENVVPYLIYNSDKESFVSGSFNGDMIHIPNSMEYLMKGSNKQIGIALKKWLDKYEEVIFVGDVLAYDWILFCDLLGETAKHIPSHVSYTPIDIATLMHTVGIDPLDITRANFVDTSDIDKGKIWQMPHNALYDALMIKKSYIKLMDQITLIKKSSDILNLLIKEMDITGKYNHVIIPEKQIKEIDKLIVAKNKTRLV